MHTAHAERALEAIDSLIAERHLLKHPFYQTWTAGKLTREALVGYARQYYRQVEAFPIYLAGIYTHCDDVDDRRLVLRNLIEEDHGEENHPELWLRFAEGLGLTREEVLGAETFGKTQKTIDSFRGACIDGSAAEGMASIYAYESMTPEVSATKIEGLKSFYDIDDERTLQFFAVHEQADREHREWDRALLKRFIKTEADAEAAIAGARTGLDALWTLLDGVNEVYCAEAA